MIPYMMQNSHKPPKSYGDCVRACIASVLEIEPHNVPHFFDFTNKEQTPDNTNIIWDEIEAWLKNVAKCGMLLVWYNQPDLKELMHTLSITATNQHYILFGISKLGNGHAVVGLNDEIVHDPSWIGTGIAEPNDNGCYLVMFFTDYRSVA